MGEQAVKIALTQLLQVSETVSLVCQRLSNWSVSIAAPNMSMMLILWLWVLPHGLPSNPRYSMVEIHPISQSQDSAGGPKGPQCFDSNHLRFSPLQCWFSNCPPGLFEKNTIEFQRSPGIFTTKTLMDGKHLLQLRGIESPWGVSHQTREDEHLSGNSCSTSSQASASQRIFISYCQLIHLFVGTISHPREFSLKHFPKKKSVEEVGFKHGLGKD